MNILLSNDDGYQAPGLAVLAESLGPLGEIHVVAPELDRSGASHSLTLDYPLHARRMQNGVIAVDGTPTDCVHLAITGLLETEPDIVVSGINSGPNMGDDVLYSGTVAAAMEGRYLGLPAMALSMNNYNPVHYETAGRVAVELICRLRDRPLAEDVILNVNVPDVPYDELAGFQATRLGYRHKAEPVVRDQDPRGKVIYWVGPAGAEQDAGPGTDFYAVKTGYVSITPLQVDLTRHNALPAMAEWLS